MSDNDRVRASISATVNEISAGYAALGIPVDDDIAEAWIILDRIQKRVEEQRRMAWLERWA